VVGHWGDRGQPSNLDYHVAVDWNFYSVAVCAGPQGASMSSSPATGVQIFHRGRGGRASHVRVAGQNHWGPRWANTWPPAQQARWPNGRRDWVRRPGGPRSGVGHRGLCRAAADRARSMSNRVCDPASAFWRLATRYPGEQLGGRLRARACRPVRVRQAFVEHPAQERAATRSPPWPRMGLGHHGNIRGPGYYPLTIGRRPIQRQGHKMHQPTIEKLHGPAPGRHGPMH